MSAPKRLRDETDDEALRALLAQGGPGLRARARDAETRARTRARIARLAALPAGALALWSSGKAVALAAGLGALGVAGVYAARSMLARSSEPSSLPSAAPSSRLAPAPHTARASPSSLPSSQAAAPAPSAAPAAVVATPTARPARRSRVVEAPSSLVVPSVAASVAPSRVALAPSLPSAPSSTPREPEQRLLDRAQEALAQSPARALAALADYDAQHPAGRQRVEYERLSIEAHFAAGNTREARARAEAFLARYPGSLYAERVRQLLRAAP